MIDVFLTKGIFYKKLLSIFFVVVFTTNLIFSFVLLPTKEAKAATPVVITGPLPVPVTTVKDPVITGWKAVDTVLQKITSWASKISALHDIWDQAYRLASDAIKQANYGLLHVLLSMITNEIIKWINGGGEPKFISDWAGFLRDAANRAGAEFLNELGLGFLCQPFAFQLKLALLPSGGFESYARCTLEDMGRNLQTFFNNFTAGGGWGTWLSLIQPNNNFYGLYVMSLEEKTRREIEAMRAAENEGRASGGFLSATECTKWRVTNLLSGSTEYTTSKAVADQWSKSGEAQVVCVDKKIITPGSVVQNEAQRAIDSGRQLIQDMIANLASQLGPFQKYVQAILTTLLNRVIQMGLEAVGEAIVSGDTSFGPTLENPNVPLPPGQPQEESAQGAITAEEILATSPILIPPLNLLKENITDELLPQQQKNLAVLNEIKDVQLQTLQTIKDLFLNNCSLPSWVSSQKISDNGITQIIKLIATDIGAITLKKTVSGTGTIFEIQSIDPLTNQQIETLSQEIAANKQWITDIDRAITANYTAIEKAEHYLALYKSATSTPEELSAAESEMQTAYNIALMTTQTAAKSQEEKLSLLLYDIQQRSLEVVEKTLDTESARGTTKEPEPGTLYYQLNKTKSKLAEVQSLLQSCLESSEEYYTPPPEIGP